VFVFRVCFLKHRNELLGLDAERSQDLGMVTRESVSPSYQLYDL